MNSLKKLSITLLSALTLAGCVSDEAGKSAGEPLSQEQQNSYLAAARPPQYFGFPLIRIDEGITYAGSARLHPRQLAKAKMLEDGLPIININGKVRRNGLNVLLDFTSSSSWLEFSNARMLGAQFMGIDGQVIPYRGTYNTGGVNSFASVVSHLRIDQLFLENTPFYTRMATDSLGPLARGIYDPKVEAILGYDNLKSFEYIRMDQRNSTIRFSASIPYTPNTRLLVEQAKIVSRRDSGLAVEGSIDGDPTPILLDFAGNFDFARGDVKVSSTENVSIGKLEFNQIPTLLLPTHSSLPRIGRKILSKYVVTICNNQGIVYFELHPSDI